RVRRSVSNDTPLPPEEPHGENPPAGALVDYVLQAAPSGPVTLEIFDAGGRLVRRFSSEDRPRPPAEPPQIAAEWLPRDEALPRRAGLNQFVWDLRYPPPPAERYGYSIAASSGPQQCRLSTPSRRTRGTVRSRGWRRWWRARTGNRRSSRGTSSMARERGLPEHRGGGRSS